jgi:uncharacterized protein
MEDLPLNQARGMRRQDWLLLLLALRDASEPLDPVRLQKGMFLFAREAHPPPAETYEFVAYDYGPFSVQIYWDLEEMADSGLILAAPMPGYSWSRHLTTASGLARAQDALDEMAPEARGRAAQLQQLKQGVLSLGFRDLLSHVYSRYPDFSDKSVFRA